MTILSRGRVISGFALLATSAVVLAGCASAPAPEATTPSDSGSSAAPALDFLPCMVSDAGGFDDKSFNQLGFEGLQQAADSLGVEYQTAESQSEDDYANNINAMVSAGCDLIITVGFLLSPATVEAALANPDVEFAIIDDAADNDFDGTIDAPNIKPILFDTAQAAFLVGYAAASYSPSGTVATWGGLNIPTVAIFSDGLSQGIEYYNTEKDASVKLLGYDPADAANYAITDGFEANDAAKNLAASFIEQGADVLVPVGGPIFQSAGAAIEDAGTDVALVGVDADLYNTYPTYDSLYLTSILKNIAPAVNDVVTSASSGSIDYAPYIGTLENDGVGYAPFHDFESKVEAGLSAELETIKASIISGDITVTSYLAS